MSASVSIYDVAKEAGVSESTVSRAFSRPELVSSKTRAKVLETARRMNFSLDRGRGGSTGRTHRIALVQNGDVASWYPGLVFSGLNSVFRPAGYDLAIYDVVDTRRLHEFLASIPDRRNVDAVVVVSFDVEPKETETLHELGIPVVGVGTAMHRETGMDAWTSVDNAQGMKLMIRYLASLGHRRIMYVGHDPESFELPFSTLARLKGFRQACEQAGVEGRTLPIPFGDWRFDVTFSILLDDESIPTALVCQQDDIAIPLILRLRDYGLRVPEDLSITGFDDAQYAETFGLTTIRQNPRLIGESAAHKVLDLLAGKTLDEPYTAAQPELIIRSSTKAVAPADG